MEEMEKLLQSMTQMKEGMEKMQKELADYAIEFELDGVRLKVHGDGIISDLTFPEGTPPAKVEKAINDANAKVKDYVTQRMTEITPEDLREE